MGEALPGRLNATASCVSTKAYFVSPSLGPPFGGANESLVDDEKYAYRVEGIVKIEFT